MARPTKLTRVRHARIVELLEDGVPFATACREVGVSVSAGYEWLYRGWGTHPDRPPTPRYVAFARAVDAVFPGGFAERYEDEDEFAEKEFSEFSESDEGFADVQSSEGTETFAEPQNRRETGDAAGFSEFPESGEGFAEFAEPELIDTPRDFAEPELIDTPRDFAEPELIDTPRDRARAREQDPLRTTEPELDEATRLVLEERGIANSWTAAEYEDPRRMARRRVGRHAPFPWLSKRSRGERSIIDEVF